MSIFGEPLPHEDDTAASLIRRTGFPPDGTYEQMPEVYMCPCCSEFSKLSEHDRLLQIVQAEKEAERRRILQLDVFDERAKPLPFDSGRRPPQWVPEDDEVLEMQPNMPPPPTLDELRRRQNQANDMRLVVTVHHGKNLAASPRDPMSVVVRCGGFEGQTAKVPLKKGALTTWDELFEFPYQNPKEPLELLVLNDQVPGDHLLGCILIPNELVNDATTGDETILPIEPRRDPSAQMTLWDGVSREGTMGSVVVSWYISKDGQDRVDETAIEQQTLDEPVRCSFVTHHIFQYTDNGSEPFAGGVLCVLRDTDDNCSESILYNLGSTQETSFSPYFSKEGYHYLPENAFKGTQLTTNKKLGHILICVPKEEGGSANEEEELLVVGAVPLDFGRLHRRGNAVLLIESKSKDDALWGEIFVEWDKHSLSDLNDKPALIQVPKESVFVTVVRGNDLCKHGQEPLEQAMLTISTANLEGTTMMAPRSKDEVSDANVIHWNQEIRFIGVDRDENKLELVVYEEENLPVSVGSCVLSQEDEGVCIVKMHEISKPDNDRGEIVLSYRRFHGPEQPKKLIEDKEGLSHDDEEVEEQEVSEEQEEHEDAEDRQPMEIDRESDLERHGDIYDDGMERNDMNSRSYETPVDNLNQYKGEGDDMYNVDSDDGNGDERDEDSITDQQRLRRKEKSPSVDSRDRYKPSSESHDGRRSPSSGARDMHKAGSEPHDGRRSPSSGARDMHKAGSESHDGRRSPSSGARDMHKAGSEPHDGRRSPSSGARDMHKAGSESHDRRRSPSSGARDMHKAGSESHDRRRSPSSGARDMHKAGSEPHDGRRSPSTGARDMHKAGSESHDGRRSPSTGARDMHKAGSEPHDGRRSPSSGARDMHKAGSEPHDGRRSPSSGARDMHKAGSESHDGRRSPSTGARDMHKAGSEPHDGRRSPSTGARDMHKAGSESHDGRRSPSSGARDMHKAGSEPHDGRRSPSSGARDMHKAGSEPHDGRRSPSSGAQGMQKAPCEPHDAGKLISVEPAHHERSASEGSQDGEKSLPPPQPSKVELQPAEDKAKSEKDATDNLHESRQQSIKPKVEPVYMPPPPEPSNVHSDRARASKMSDSSSRRPQSTDNGGSSRRSQGFIQPWYPAGNPESQQHVPYERSTLSQKNKESIRELERRRNRLVEESVRRGTSPRVTGTRGLPEESNDDM